MVRMMVFTAAKKSFFLMILFLTILAEKILDKEII